MKIELIKKLWAKILLSSLFVLSFGKSAQGETFSGWGGVAETPQQVPTDITLAVVNLVKSLILTPLLIIVVLIYGTHFYYKIRKKDIGSNLRRMFNLGERSILLLLISYAAVYIFKLSKTNSLFTDEYILIVLYMFLFLGLLALLVYIFLLILFIKQLHYRSQIKNKSNNIKNNNENKEKNL